jgi:hypothetical protein
MFPKDTSGGDPSVDYSSLTFPENNPPPDKPKSKCHHFCGLRHTLTEGANWADKHKAAIAGIAAGALVGLGCEAVTGGVGSVGCAALAGAAANMVQYSVETEVEHKGNFSLGGMLETGVEGAIVGGVTGGLGSIGGKALKAGVSTLLEGAGAKAAVGAGRAAAKKEASSIASGLTRNAFDKGAADAGEGAAAGAGDDAASSAGGGCKGQSFTAVTAVLMSNGSTKPISEVKAGDKVRATDPTTGKTTDQTVEAVHVDHDRAMTDLAVEVNGRKTVVHTTQQHPFWDKTTKRWVDAGDLTPSARLAANGRAVVVITVVNFASVRDMYDLTVSNVHTFYVIAGWTPVLVHNCGGAGLLDPEHEAVGDANAKGGIYALVGESGKVVRTGMAKDLKSRLATHARKYPGLTGVVLYRTDDLPVRRGLEELVQNWYSPLLAKQDAVDLVNPNRSDYVNAALGWLKNQ